MERGEGKGEIDSFAPSYTHKRLVWVDTIDFIVWILVFLFFFSFLPPWLQAEQPRRRCLVACFSFFFSNCLGFFHLSLYGWMDVLHGRDGRIARMYK